ncbi:MAG: hypothetical protein AAB785_02135 [Patescibacteria group bacterium]
MKKKNRKKLIKIRSQVDPTNPYLETQKEHKKWYNVWEMGKQRGKPKAVPPKALKKKGQFIKHQHR